MDKINKVGLYGLSTLYIRRAAAGKLVVRATFFRGGVRNLGRCVPNECKGEPFKGRNSQVGVPNGLFRGDNRGFKNQPLNVV